jgi:DNA-binding NarL/FixJ family response regulator
MARLYLFAKRCVVRDALQALLARAGHTVVGADGDAEVAASELKTAAADQLIADLRWGCAPVLALLQALEPWPQPPRCLLLLDERAAVAWPVLRTLPEPLVWQWLPPGVSGPGLVQAVADVDEGQRQSAPWRRTRHAGAPALSALERRVLRDSALGQPATEIASALGLTARAVSSCRRHAMDRLGLRDAAMLTRYALRQGWIDRSVIDTE